MENIVGIIVTDKKMGSVAFLTWGRVFDRVDPKPLIEVLKKALPKYGLKDIKKVKVCYSLQEVADYMYFYENVICMSWTPIPSGKKAHKTWATRMRQAITQGEELYYLGGPKEKLLARYRKIERLLAKTNS